MTRIRNRAALIALPLALGALAVGASSASANSDDWGDNGSGTCNTVQGSWTPSQAGAELGTYCMQSVTGWIQINEAATQNQAISCSNNDSASGLSYSTDGQGYVSDAPWPALASGDDGGQTYNNVGWQTGDGGDAYLSGGEWQGGTTTGDIETDVYGSGGAAVTNFGGSGGWQAAIACVNRNGGEAQSSGSGGQVPVTARRTLRPFGPPFADVAKASARVRVRDRTIDSADKKKGTAFLAREYVVKKNVTRTDKRTCPVGMVRKGKLSYTVQEFPADNKSPIWKDRSLVDVKMTAKGKNAGSVKMTLKRAKNPTVVQIQLRCGKR